ncbi:DUF309 domain-containing protein [Bacillus canaveralius]|uniref:DUF309 domain-containing protein n=1 Tax=Bacillus canaveralius TaxID=1403243 RepID=A0A2N5GRL3_9BACI|nr:MULTISPECIES: DUF309 domain-containing protein [Bacillus]PLR84568.1 DUF309 domain-containing protein [Bacillus sp. V33-4]PLR86082.1 DUF309 domain-containing protein [Bacillus canaveralius]PLS00202.1 DUF309 domain-containing protein [Bacillus canaveralius]RSK52034.1 DUF309 domain-containing protein [Bacillus canaveralius]
MYPKAYISYLAHFHGDRDYFECHEILEEYWKSINGEKESVWVGLILTAVSAYHHRRGNFSGAHKTLKKAISIFESKRGDLAELSLDEELLLENLNDLLAAIENKKPYTSFAFPITDKMLIASCIQECEFTGMNWESPSDLNNENLLHRHLLRDRTDVIEEREQARREKNRG